MRPHNLGLAVRDGLHLGPDLVHVAIIHGPGRPNDWAPGSLEDLGISRNLLTNAGRDLVAAALGATGFGVTGTVATASTATSLTATGTPFVVDAHKGWIVIAEEGVNAPVWGNIGSNTTSVLTVDAWRTGDDTAGTTPAATANYLILPNLRCRYMALTENAAPAAATDTILTGEITTGGAARALTTYAHTGGAATLALTKTFSITATFPAIHKIGLFTASNPTAAGIMVYETVLNADANVILGDTFAVTWTNTVSG